MIRQCGGLFQHAEGVNDFGRHRFNSHADFKVFMAALRLRAPKPVRGHLHFAHGIMFNAVFHPFIPLSLNLEVLNDVLEHVGAAAQQCDFRIRQRRKQFGMRAL